MWRVGGINTFTQNSLKEGEEGSFCRSRSCVSYLLLSCC